MKDPNVEPDMGHHATGATRSATPTSLLQRLKDRDGTAWQQLLQLYGSTVEKWCRRAGVSAEDAADLRQVSPVGLVGYK